MNYPRALVIQYEIEAEKKGDVLDWTQSADLLDQLLLGFPIHLPLKAYAKRNRLYAGFSVGYDDALFFLEGSLELTRATLKKAVFDLEVVIIPSKLDAVQRDSLVALLRNSADDPKFKVGWDDSLAGIKKRSTKAMKRLLKQLRNDKKYSGEDDLQLEDIDVTHAEALEFLGYEPAAKKKEVKTNYKAKYRELTVKYHPDADGGDENKFMFLQKCKSTLDSWLKK
jgi:hypothetical protein